MGLFKGFLFVVGYRNCGFKNERKKIRRVKNNFNICNYYEF